MQYILRRWLSTKACAFLCAKSSVIGDKVDIKFMYIIEYFMGVAFFAPFVHVDRGGVCRISTLVHSRGGGGQNWVKIGLRSC